jgi:hypothetical protein
MANTKISALTSATTPLAGTEVLPIVQSSATVKVATNDLTVRNVRANATTGILQVTGPAAASTRVMTVPDANFTAARTDAAQSFTGDQTLSTGNLIIGTSGKGIDFSATPGTGTSELLNDYEEGTWTPTVSGFGTPTYVQQTGKYTKVGNLVHITGKLNFTGASGASAVSIGGLPFASGDPSDTFQRASCFVEGDWAGCLTFIASYGMFRTDGSTLQGVKNSAGTSVLAVATDFSAAAEFNFSLTYYV